MAMQALLEYAERDTGRALYCVEVDVEASSSPDWKHNVMLQRGHVSQVHEFDVSMHK